MSLEISIDFDKASLALIQKHLAQLGAGGVRTALVQALGDTGHHARRVMGKHLTREFDRPTPYITRAPKYVLDEKRLALSVLPTHDTRRFAFAGNGQGGGQDAQHVLQAQEWGGQRAAKRFELALTARGILPAGMQTAIPLEPFTGSDDGRGNFRGTFTRRLLSALSSLRGQTKPATAGKKPRGQKTGGGGARGAHINGWQLFVIREKKNTLAAGIWVRQGGQVRPIVIFTRPGHYRKRSSMQRVASESNLQQILQKRMRYRLRRAVGI